MLGMSVRARLRRSLRFLAMTHHVQRVYQYTLLELVAVTGFEPVTPRI